MSQDFTVDRQDDQPTRCFFVVEAAGMVPLVKSIADPYGIPVFSSGRIRLYHRKTRPGAISGRAAKFRSLAHR